MFIATVYLLFMANILSKGPHTRSILLSIFPHCTKLLIVYGRYWCKNPSLNYWYQWYCLNKIDRVWATYITAYSKLAISHAASKYILKNRKGMQQTQGKQNIYHWQSAPKYDKIANILHTSDDYGKIGFKSCDILLASSHSDL